MFGGSTAYAPKNDPDECPVRVEPPPPKSRPLRRDAELNLARILAAATDVFAEYGYEASMEQIAARAGSGSAPSTGGSRAKPICSPLSSRRPTAGPRRSPGMSGRGAPPRTGCSSSCAAASRPRRVGG